MPAHGLADTLLALQQQTKAVQRLERGEGSVRSRSMLGLLLTSCARRGE